MELNVINKFKQDIERDVKFLYNYLWEQYRVRRVSSEENNAFVDRVKKVHDIVMDLELYTSLLPPKQQQIEHEICLDLQKTIFKFSQVCLEIANQSPFSNHQDNLNNVYNEILQKVGAKREATEERTKKIPQISSSVTVGSISPKNEANYLKLRLLGQRARSLNTLATPYLSHHEVKRNQTTPISPIQKIVVPIQRFNTDGPNPDDNKIFQPRFGKSVLPTPTPSPQNTRIFIDDDPVSPPKLSPPNSPRRVDFSPPVNQLPHGNITPIHPNQSYQSNQYIPPSDNSIFNNPRMSSKGPTTSTILLSHSHLSSKVTSSNSSFNSSNTSPNTQNNNNNFNNSNNNNFTPITQQSSSSSSSSSLNQNNIQKAPENHNPNVRRVINSSKSVGVISKDTENQNTPSINQNKTTILPPVQGEPPTKFSEFKKTATIALKFIKDLSDMSINSLFVNLRDKSAQFFQLAKATYHSICLCSNFLAKVNFFF